MPAVSIELLPDPPAADVVAAIEVADDVGLDTAFLADEVYHRDAWLLLASAAARTRTIRLAAGVAHVTLRDPLLVAQQLATLDEMSGGRAAVAFSVGNLAMLEQFGRDPGELHVAPRLLERMMRCAPSWTMARSTSRDASSRIAGCSRRRGRSGRGCRC
ncbi:MAG TPA: LLM class flavin-dependent oxidoreductase [Solirubrobacteraceae bacterium]|nr:LLM class flavin-dependent oxidoreductase [Solirubrobacteraceae bacterium]